MLDALYLQSVSFQPDRTAEDVPSTTADLAKEAMRVFEKAIELQKQGNWAGYGEEIKKLGQLLRRITK